MASNELKSELSTVIGDITRIDKDKLFRADYGRLSLEPSFAPILEEINSKMILVYRAAESLHDDQITPIMGELHSIKEVMEQQANFQSQEDYVTNRNSFMDNIREHLDRIQLSWPPIVTATLEQRGLLKDEGPRQEYEDTIQSLRAEGESLLQRVREQGNETIQDVIASAEVSAREIVGKARSTAAGTSVAEAQRQFKDAQAALDKRVKLWGVLGSASILVFIGTAICFMLDDLPDEWRWEVIYHSSIRISILTAIGTVAAFCLKILRAHLHMREKNRHRQHIANSMEAFVQAAVTPEQRDSILGQLVESVAQFGNSGLVQREDDHIYRSKMMIDPIVRALSPRPKRDD